RREAAASLLQRAEAERPVAQFPDDAQHPAPAEQVDQHHDRPSRARPAYRPTSLWRFSHQTHPDSAGAEHKACATETEALLIATKTVARTVIMPARIAPAERPYESDMEATLARLMPPGREPLLFFRTMARDPRLFRRLMA